MKGIDSGELRRRINIEVYAPLGQDAAGEDIENWDTVATVWCSIDTKQGHALQLNQINTLADITTHIVTMRYYPGIVPARYRLRYGDLPSEYAPQEPKYYTINTVIDENEGHYKLTLMCSEVTA